MPNTSNDFLTFDALDIDKIVLIAECGARLANECAALGYDPSVIVTSSASPSDLALALANTLPLTHKKIKPICLRALSIYLMPNTEFTKLTGNNRCLRNRLRKIASGLTDYGDILLGATAICLMTRSLAALMPPAVTTTPQQ